MNKHYDQLTIIDVLKHYKDGMDVNIIAKNYDILPSTISNWAKKAGIRRPKRIPLDWEYIKSQLS